MPIIAHLALEGSIRELDEVLDALAEPDLLIAYRAATLASEDTEPTFEPRANDAETLSRFYKACCDHEVIIDVRRITHDRE